MDRLRTELQSFESNDRYSPAIRTALRLGLVLLDKYYSLTDHSEFYRIAMVLHPRYKLRYFEKLKLEKEWIKTAERIVRDEFKHTYSNYVIAKTSTPRFSKSKAANNNDSEPDLDSSGMSSDEDEFASELDRYLSTPRIKDVKDPLDWWYGNRGTYPRLWRMARDY